MNTMVYRWLFQWINIRLYNALHPDWHGYSLLGPLRSGNFNFPTQMFLLKSLSLDNMYLNQYVGFRERTQGTWMLHPSPLSMLFWSATFFPFLANKRWNLDNLLENWKPPPLPLFPIQKNVRCAPKRLHSGMPVFSSLFFLFFWRLIQRQPIIMQTECLMRWDGEARGEVFAEGENNHFPVGRSRILWRKPAMPSVKMMVILISIAIEWKCLFWYLYLTKD